jgi:hypothetical protein
MSTLISLTSSSLGKQARHKTASNHASSSFIALSIVGTDEALTELTVLYALCGSQSSFDFDGRYQTCRTNERHKPSN